MKKINFVVIVGITLLSACTTTQKDIGIGSIIGGGLGAIVGHQSGHGAEGALIGAAAGAIGGGIVGEKADTKFCPKCGRRFTSSVEYCPYDGGELSLIDK
ncbi:MAG: glycine zipper 2TM domain-containing protein [Candidatus Omnitrophica bacterium]|nr:glycine zipper 2TM domain-containing protein [Candidatus Omnitrophota bacterium]MCK5494563.1 glycine zipper 2TM domain-containing protein [Candidatus Omnitrophota bacterium]